MGFHDDVTNTHEISSCLQNGLGAVKNSDRIKFNCKDPRNINGSVDIDSCVADLYPESSRWDYALGYNEKCYFVEIHPASTSEVNTMLNKLRWLIKWLKEQKSPLLSSHAGFHWIASGSVSISKNSPQARMLSASGLNGPKRQCECSL